MRSGRIRGGGASARPLCKRGTIVYVWPRSKTPSATVARELETTGPRRVGGQIKSQLIDWCRDASYAPADAGQNMARHTCAQRSPVLSLEVRPEPGEVSSAGPTGRGQKFIRAPDAPQGGRLGSRQAVGPPRRQKFTHLTLTTWIVKRPTPQGDVGEAAAQDQRRAAHRAPKGPGLLIRHRCGKVNLAHAAACELRSAAVQNGRADAAPARPRGNNELRDEAHLVFGVDGQVIGQPAYREARQASVAQLGDRQESLGSDHHLADPAAPAELISAASTKNLSCVA